MATGSTGSERRIDDQDLYVDQNGDGIINQDDLRPFHDPAPKWILGHSSYLAYGQRGTWASRSGRTWAITCTTTSPPTSGDYSRAHRQGSPYNLHTSVLETKFATPAAAVGFLCGGRVVPADGQPDAGLHASTCAASQARVFGTVQNVFTITGYSGVDPAANVAPSPTTSSVNGIDNNIYPRSRTFSGGLSLRL